MDDNRFQTLIIYVYLVVQDNDDKCIQFLMLLKFLKIFLKGCNNFQRGPTGSNVAAHFTRAQNDLIWSLLYESGH